jgi:hypothetical protein
MEVAVTSNWLLVLAAPSGIEDAATRRYASPRRPHEIRDSPRPRNHPAIKRIRGEAGRQRDPRR